MLTRSPSLTLFDPNPKTIVSADASSFSLGAVLLQSNRGEFKPVAYISRSLTQAEQKHAQIKKKRHWPSHGYVNICTVQHQAFRTDANQSAASMMRFQFTISHVTGKQLVIAETLSRSPSENSNSYTRKAAPSSKLRCKPYRPLTKG